MKAARHLVTLVCVLLSAVAVEAQDPNRPRRCYVKETNLTKRVIPYLPSVRRT